MVRWYVSLNGRIFNFGVVLQLKFGNGSISRYGFGFSVVSLLSLFYCRMVSRRIYIEQNEGDSHAPNS